MATFQEDIAGALQEIRETYAKTGTFIHGNQEINLVNVVIGKRTFRFVDQGGLTIRKETREVIVEASQMLGVEPQVGDRFRQTFAGFVHTFMVVGLNNEPCFYHSDDENNTMRIHTMLKSKVPE